MRHAELPTLVRRRLASIVLGVAMALAGCGTAPQPVGTTPVALYGRNATPGDAWFAAQPVVEPLVSIGFGADIGVGCFDIPVGSELVMLDGPPGRGQANVIRVIAPIGAPVGGPRRELWVDVAPDGSVTTGQGLPPWWSGGSGC